MKATLMDGTVVTLTTMGALSGLRIRSVELAQGDIDQMLAISAERLYDRLSHLRTRFPPVPTGGFETNYQEPLSLDVLRAAAPRADFGTRVETVPEAVPADVVLKMFDVLERAIAGPRPSAEGEKLGV